MLQSHVGDTRAHLAERPPLRASVVAVAISAGNSRAEPEPTNTSVTGGTWNDDAGPSYALVVRTWCGIS